LGPGQREAIDALGVTLLVSASPGARAATVRAGRVSSAAIAVGFKATVGPGTVTLSWSQTITTGITFYQIFQLDSQDDVIRTVLLPPQATSLSTPIPSGDYRVALVSGGPCGTTSALADALVFTFPETKEVSPT
jgi:hypothetical protein